MLRHYLRLSQQTLGMMGVSLFGTCTMKYNPAVSEAAPGCRRCARCTRCQHRTRMQGTLEIVHRLDLALRELSGMDQFIFQAGGGADAAYLHACMTRAYHDARGELARRDEIITTIQAHPCNAATSAAAGFKVITLPLEADGYASVAALRAACRDRTAALMINNPDDMGIYNPHINEWVDIVHEAGGLCFYDHANFNGVMGKIRAAELGFDACMFMLHKTFGAPKAGGGPAVGAYGCTRAARAVPARPAGQARTAAPSGGRAAGGDRPGPRVHGQPAAGASRPTPGSGRWAPRASARPLTCPFWPTTTWIPACGIRGITQSHPQLSGPRWRWPATASGP